jgi:hypothetical protein
MQQQGGDRQDPRRGILHGFGGFRIRDGVAARVAAPQQEGAMTYDCSNGLRRTGRGKQRASP